MLSILTCGDDRLCAEFTARDATMMMVSCENYALLCVWVTFILAW